jgi:hypothetical protein
MRYRIYGALIASLGAVALMLAANETLAQSRAAPAARIAPAHSIARPFAGHPFRHFRGNNLGTFWPGGGFFYDPSTSQPLVDVTEPPSRDIRYTYTYDVPWDWAHRYPPAVVPSDRPYVTTCPSETVTVPGRNGEQTVTIMRCY